MIKERTWYGNIFIAVIVSKFGWLVQARAYRVTFVLLMKGNLAVLWTHGRTP